MQLYESIGKVPIEVGSRYGYAMDPIFEGLFHAACKCVEEGLGSVKQVDDIVRRTPVRPSSGFVDQLVYPVERPLPKNGRVEVSENIDVVLARSKTFRKIARSSFRVRRIEREIIDPNVGRSV